MGGEWAQVRVGGGDLCVRCDVCCRRRGSYVNGTFCPHVGGVDGFVQKARPLAAITTSLPRGGTVHQVLENSLLSSVLFVILPPPGL